MRETRLRIVEVIDPPKVNRERAKRLRRASNARRRDIARLWRERASGAAPYPILWLKHDCDRWDVVEVMNAAYAESIAEGYTVRQSRRHATSEGCSHALGLLRYRRGTCGALARSTGKPCMAKGTGRGGRCKLHGGASTGPRTPEGKARALANLRRGNAAMSGGGKKLDGRSGHPNAPPLHAR